MEDFIFYRRYTKEHSMFQADQAFLDFYLKPAVQTIPHVLEDTRDFLSRLSYLQDITENAILVSFDMVGLYPNIPHEEGTDIMRIFK